MKTTKTQLTSATDSFYWSLQDAQGGTVSEQIKGLHHNVAHMQKKVDAINVMLTNLNKSAASDDYLMERANNCQSRLDSYFERVNAKTLPTNVIKVSFAA